MMIVGRRAEFRKYLADAAEILLARSGNRYLKIGLSQATQELLRDAEYYLLRHKVVKNFVREFKNCLGFAAAPLEVCIEYAAMQTCKGGRSLPKDDPKTLIRFYKWVVLPCMEFKSRALELLVLTHPDTTATERLIFQTGFWIAKEFDKIFEKWWQWVVIPYRTSPLPPEELKQLIKETGKTNMYSVLCQPNGAPIFTGLTPELIQAQAKEIPLADAFPNEIARIQAYLLYLVEKLPSEEKEYRRYFGALYRAIGNRDLAKMERYWLAVDRAWVGIPPKRVMPVHMMEDGYHDPFRVSPEYRVMLRGEEFATTISLAREYMRTLAAEIGEDADIAKLDAIDIGPFIPVVNGGSGIDFRFSGQSVPNRPKAQTGLKSFPRYGLDGNSS
jgi:hypothetical protein